jgi:hypothetical protein
MRPVDRSALADCGLDTAQGRRIFVNASRSLVWDIAYVAYLMEQAVLAHPLGTDASDQRDTA